MVVVGETAAANSIEIHDGFALERTRMRAALAAPVTLGSSHGIDEGLRRASPTRHRGRNALVEHGLDAGESDYELVGRHIPLC
jgi:hypothetical protein